jgi:glycosyltransferase involved in cell wall biosynthesis
MFPLLANKALANIRPTGIFWLYCRNMRKKLFHVEFRWIFCIIIYKAWRPAATERCYRHRNVMKHCCSQRPICRWKDTTVYKKQWAQKVWERERLQEVVVLQHTDLNLFVNYFHTFFVVDYVWRPARWSLNYTYKYMEKTPIQSNRTQNHYHAALLSSYKLVCRGEWQYDFKINGCCLELSVEGTYTTRFAIWSNDAGINHSSKRQIENYKIVPLHTLVLFLYLIMLYLTTLSLS